MCSNHHHTAGAEPELSGAPLEDPEIGYIPPNARQDQPDIIRFWMKKQGRHTLADGSLLRAVPTWGKPGSNPGVVVQLADLTGRTFHSRQLNAHPANVADAACELVREYLTGHAFPSPPPVGVNRPQLQGALKP